MRCKYEYSSRWLLLDVCNVSASSKLQRTVQQCLGGGRQECVQLYLLICLLLYFNLFTYLQGRVHFLLPVGSPFSHCFCLPFLSPKVRAYQQPIHIRVNSTMMKRFEFQWVQPAFAFYSSFDVPILFVFIQEYLAESWGWPHDIFFNRNTGKVDFKHVPSMGKHCITPRYIENREEKRDQMISYFRKRLSNK